MPCGGTLGAHGPRPRLRVCGAAPNRWTAAAIGRRGQCRRSRSVRQGRRDSPVLQAFRHGGRRACRVPGGPSRSVTSASPTTSALPTRSERLRQTPRDRTDLSPAAHPSRRLRQIRRGPADLSPAPHPPPRLRHIRGTQPICHTSAAPTTSERLRQIPRDRADLSPAPHPPPRPRQTRRDRAGLSPVAHPSPRAPHPPRRVDHNHIRAGRAAGAGAMRGHRAHRPSNNQQTRIAAPGSGSRGGEGLKRAAHRPGNVGAPGR